MATRDALLNAGRWAGNVLRDTGAKGRIESGYTRINPLRIAETAGVAVMFQNLEKLLGAYIKEGRPGIIVNRDRPPGLVHMTCAHELGHYFLGHDTTTDIEIEYNNNATLVEREADQFAYSLLTPQWLLSKIMRRKGWTMQSLYDPACIYQLSLRLGISFTSMVWTLNRLNVLSNDDALKSHRISPKTIKSALTGAERAVKGHADVWLLDESDRGAVLEPHENDIFILELENKAGAGYIWSVDEIRANGFHVEVPGNHDVRAQSVEQHFGKDPEVGHSSVLRFKISRPLEKQIDPGAQLPFSMVEHRPWQTVAQSDRRYAFTAEYEEMKGLDPTSKLRLLEKTMANT